MMVAPVANKLTSLIEKNAIDNFSLVLTNSQTREEYVDKFMTETKKFEKDGKLNYKLLADYLNKELKAAKLDKSAIWGAGKKGDITPGDLEVTYNVNKNLQNQQGYSFTSEDFRDSLANKMAKVQNLKSKAEIEDEKKWQETKKKLDDMMKELYPDWGKDN
ncbi:MAG: hypothetical protein V4691_00890 [Pseudomonadota bacterium]